MLRAIVVLAGVLVGGLGTMREAEACACCDAQETRAPVGWSEKGDAVLVDASSSAACESKRWLEVWAIGAAEPSACYDLYSDPDKKVDCAAIAAPEDFKKKPKRSRQAARFPRKVSALAAKNVRVLQTRLDDERGENEVTVEVKVGNAWKGVWSGTIEYASSTQATARVWPNARGDRAMLVVTSIDQGTGNESTHVRWVTLSTGARP